MSETPFPHRGKYWQFDNIVVEPLDAQKPVRRSGWGGQPRSGSGQVVERGYNMSPGQHPPPRSPQQVAQFREEAVEARAAASTRCMWAWRAQSTREERGRQGSGPPAA